MNNSKNQPPSVHPLATLPREDLDLVTQLVLHSGSLKDLAISYDVSYPTIRIRLDRVIERLRGAVAGREQDALTELLATLVERGELSITNARAVRQAASDLLSAQHGASTSDVGAHEPSAQPKGDR